MSITEQGRKGEAMARDFLKSLGVNNLFQADWMAMKDNTYYVVEVKHKEKFKAPPFDGHGLDIRQVNARMKFYQDTGIRCLFLVFDTDGSIFWGWLDDLEKTPHLNTRNGVRIYNLKYFHKAGTFTEQEATDNNGTDNQLNDNQKEGIENAKSA